MFVPILAYHKIQREFELGLSYTTPRQFEKQIAYLHDRGFKSISIARLLSSRPVPTNSVIITFDDAYESVYKNAFPILCKYNFTGTLFVITKFAGKLNGWDYHSGRFQFSHCSWDQIRCLARAGWEIGSHTVSHPLLRKLSPRELWFEIRYSKDIIEQKIQRSTNVFSYPFGWYNKGVIECVQKAGYLGACTLGDRMPVIPSRYALFRRGVYVFEPLAYFKQKLQNNRFSHLDDVRQTVFTRVARINSMRSIARVPKKIT